MSVLRDLLVILLATAVPLTFGALKRRVPITPVTRTPEEIRRTLEENNIIPDIIQVAPKSVIQVVLNTGFKLELGNTIEGKADLWTIPNILSWPHNPKRSHTLAVIDPDAPQADDPYYRQWLDWLVVDIPRCRVVDGTTVRSYVQPLIPKTSDPHRIIYLVYEQPMRKINFEENIDQEDLNGTSRHNWSIQAFADKYGMGPPIAVNFFYAIHYWDYP